MEIRHNTHSVNSNLDNSTKFSIQANSKAYKILSDKLYSDKILAVIRELSTNAYDSHIEADNEKTPFEVHLPSHEEPWFSVKDFGTGMSHDLIMTLYTSYFGSNKTDSNELIGALGLGSKSPFAYTDAFTVDSIHEGMHNSYICSFDTDGIPTISHLGTRDSREHSGVEVKLSVKQSDFESFRNKAKNVYRVFKVKPKVYGREFKHFEDETLLSGDDWILSKKIGWTESHQCFAVQGSIAYPINETITRNYVDEERIVWKAEFVLRNKFFIQFNIGDLDVAASREDLSYDKITIKNIINKAIRIYDEFHNLIQPQFDKCSSVWEAHKLYKFWNNSLFSFHDYFSAKTKMYYKETHINNSSIYIDNHLFKDLSAIKYKCDWSGLKREDKNKYSSWNLDPNDDIKFIYNDMVGRKPVTRAKYYATVNEKFNHFFITAKDPEILSKFITHIGNPEFVKTSELPDKPRVKGDKNPNEKPIRIIDEVMHKISPANNISYSFEDLPKGKKFYVIASRAKIEGLEGVLETPVSAIKMRERLKFFDVIKENHPIFVVPKAIVESKRFKKISNMFKLVDYYSNRIPKIALKLAPEVIQWKTDNTILASMTPEGNIQYILNNDRIMKHVSKDSPLNHIKESYINLSKKIEESRARVDFIFKICRENKMEFGLDKTLEKPVLNYPMIDLLSHWEFKEYIAETKAKIIADYINMVDKNERI